MCALRFLDSFDTYETGDILTKWTAASVCDVVPGEGRRGTAAFRMSTGSVRKALDNQPTWIVGVALRLGGLPPDVSAVSILELRDGTTTQIDLRVNLDGVLSVTRGGTVLATSGAFRLSATVYYYLELLATIHPSAGVVRVAVDGTTRMALTNVNTQVTANSYVNELILKGSSVSFYSFFDDLYLCDGTGTTNKGLLGDCRVDALLPTADGTYSEWTPSAGTAHYALLDDPAPNDDTDYIVTSTAGVRDSQQFANLAPIPNPVIYGIQHSVHTRKDDAGLRQIKLLRKSGAVTEVGAPTYTLPSSYTYYTEMVETDPATGAAWTTAAVNAIEAGVEHQ